MLSLASPFEIAAAALAIGWPFAAGIGVVVWSKRRAAARRRRLEAADAELKSLFRAVEAEPAPERLALVADALQEAEAMRPSPAAEPAPKTPLGV